LPEDERFFLMPGEVAVSFTNLTATSSGGGGGGIAGEPAFCTCPWCNAARGGPYVTGTLTPEMEQSLRAQREAQVAAARERERAWQERTTLAHARLLAWMSDEQAESYRASGHFTVTASDGSRWRILATGGQTGNVILLNDAGERLRGYCAHPYNCPAAEAYLAQALAIMTDVHGFLKVANPYTVYPQSQAEAAAGPARTFRSLLEAFRRDPPRQDGLPGPGPAA
jgi:hypothetical protein